MGFLDKLKGKSSGVSTHFKPEHTVKIVRDAAGTPVVSLEKIKSNGVSLVKKAESASAALSKAGLLGIRGRGIVLLDHSGSMMPDYENGGVQTLTERALAYMLQFASDESITVIPFDSHVKPFVKVTLSNYQDVVNREIYKRSNMGGTNLAAALEAVKKEAEKTNELLYVAVITDGNPDDPTFTTKIACQLASYPVFLKFLALRSVPYLQKLDDLDDSHRLLDNADAKFFSSLSAITDEAFAEAMAEELSGWIDLAKQAGVLTEN